jgi:hypothetical protein
MNNYRLLLWKITRLSHVLPFLRILCNYRILFVITSLSISQYQYRFIILCNCLQPSVTFSLIDQRILLSSLFADIGFLSNPFENPRLRCPWFRMSIKMPDARLSVFRLPVTRTCRRSCRSVTARSELGVGYFGLVTGSSVGRFSRHHRASKFCNLFGKESFKWLTF